MQRIGFLQNMMKKIVDNLTLRNKKDFFLKVKGIYIS